jgi:hypothetical protein
MTSGAFDATPSDDRGGRAFGLGRRWAFVAAAVVAAAAAVGLVLLLTAGGGSKPVAGVYGHLPSWLPKSAQPVKSARPTSSQYEQATTTHPILGEEQGYTVHAVLLSGSVDITAVGPGFAGYVTSYAARGLWPASKPVPSTFYVTLAAVKGTIPISSAAFSVENQAYQTVKASVTLKNGGKAPAAVHAGQSLTLAVHTTTLEGQGAIAWAPTDSKALVAWIYQVELD